ncbi:MAG: hypothetical protein COX57_02690 [Alphaproteobacteria bacterium CG_4_10_14_0_2_um_filter_63_37]|nr:MAG: hypothetical protein AUJ55_10335 [Proteobacteria bacterium CG1_02_64_396]PJA25585.1 MAG: hypothetical protein COX57_02690 [Alphaproteobacteria bacterium CG_4_10_14_0_2_um_filter_63_37]
MRGQAGWLGAWLLLTLGSLSNAWGDVQNVRFAWALLGDGRAEAARIEFERALFYGGLSEVEVAGAMAGLVAARIKGGHDADARGTLAQLEGWLGARPILWSDPDVQAAIGEMSTALLQGGIDPEPFLLKGGEHEKMRYWAGAAAWQHDPARASALWKQIPEGSPERTMAELWRRKAWDHPPKYYAPDKAGWLSLIPGAGHLYLDRPMDALTAFGVNALLMAATADTVRKKEWGLGLLLGSVTVTWYGGTIFSAVSLAQRQNREERLRWPHDTMPGGWSMP